MPNLSHENHLIFMRMTMQVTYIFIPIVSLKDSFCHNGKSKLGIGLFIHELLREPLIRTFINIKKLKKSIEYLCSWKQSNLVPRVLVPLDQQVRLRETLGQSVSDNRILVIPVELRMRERVVQDGV